MPYSLYRGCLNWIVHVWVLNQKSAALQISMVHTTFFDKIYLFLH